MKPEIVTEEPISMSDVKVEIESGSKEEEVNLRVQKVKDYLEKFNVISQSKAKELEKKIEALKLGRLDLVHIKKIVDLLHVTAEDVKNILKGYTITISQENAKKIAETVEAVIK